MEELENMETKEEKQRANLLRHMRVCRFCLDENGPFTNIYEKDAKQSVPLPVQIMACVAIEVFTNDSMPKWICDDCKQQTNQAYSFKSTCKRTDDALKLYLATGSFVKPARTPRPEDNRVGVKRVMVTSPSQPAKTVKVDSAKVSQPTPVQITKKEVTEDTPIAKGSSASESILGIADDEISQQESESQLEFPDMEEQEESTMNPVLKVPQVDTDIYPCPHCERSFPLKQLLDLHRAIHERERSFSCDQCHRKFFTKYDLGKHLQTHTDSKPYSCVVCDKQFSRESLLHRHEKIHVNVPKYLCPQCDRTFLTKEDVEAHAEKHNKKRPYTCGICGKGFVFKQGLERHEITHVTEKPHKCNYCEASFASPIKLTRHITSHAGLRPYPCKRCGRTFLLSHHLTRHMRTHIAAKSSSLVPVGEFKCDVCSMSFKRKDSLINHSAIHSMVNLRCVICNTEFETAQKVKEHITTHLSSLPYPCDKCDYSFETQTQLIEHEMKHAEMEYEEQIEKEVTEEELNKRAASEEGDDEEQYLGEDDITEFTITSDLENPEVVRRSKRETKIKNYAEFLKEELGSDVEDIQDDDTSQDVEMTPTKPIIAEEDPIKPIIRTEGTKVYSRKSNVNRVKPIILNTAAETKEAPLEQINEPQSVAPVPSFNYNDKAIEALGDKQFVDMKIGNKLLRVQKLVLSQAEIQAMAKQGRLSTKSGTIILKKTMRKEKAPVAQISIEAAVDEASKSIAVQKPQIKKTYQRVKDIKDILEEATEGEPSTSTFPTAERVEELQEFT